MHLWIHASYIAAMFIAAFVAYMHGQSSRKQLDGCKGCPVIGMARSVLAHPYERYYRDELRKMIDFKEGKS